MESSKAWSRARGGTMQGFVSDAAQFEFVHGGWNIFLKGDEKPILVLSRTEGS